MQPLVPTDIAMRSEAVFAVLKTVVALALIVFAFSSRLKLQPVGWRACTMRWLLHPRIAALI